MSFDLAVLTGNRVWTARQAAEAYERLCEDPDAAGVLEPDQRIEAFVTDITGRWPQIDDMSDDDIDESPWSVEFDQSLGHVISCIVSSRVEEVYPVYVETALRHGLYVYDPQADELHTPMAADQDGTGTAALC